MHRVVQSFTELIELEDMNEQFLEGFKMLKRFESFGSNMEKCVNGITDPMKKWLEMVNQFFDQKQYLELESGYVYYKKKLAMLVNEIELMQVREQFLGRCKMKRIDRVRF